MTVSAILKEKEEGTETEKRSKKDQKEERSEKEKKEEEGKMKVYSEKIYTPDGIINGTMVFENGKIVDIHEGKDADAIDESGKIIIPGVIDTHNHGGFGYSYQPGITDEEVDRLLLADASRGITGTFPTMFSSQKEVGGFKAAARAAKRKPRGARVLGIHSEGPWGSRVGEKGINTGYPAVDLDYARAMLEAGDGWLKLVAIAPEVDHADEAIHFFKDHGVKMAMFHTNATYKEAMHGIEQGIDVATHLGNVMTGLHHRDIGAFGAGLTTPSVTCEVICDGFHVCNEMLALILKFKEQDQIVMISDNVEYAGLPAGNYRNLREAEGSDRAITTVTEDGRILSMTGRLGGSGLSVLYDVSNLVRNVGLPLEQVVPYFSKNPARVYGLEGKGNLAPGYDADFVVIDEDFQVQSTWVEGEKVYDAQTDTVPMNEAFIQSTRIPDEK